MKKFKLYKAEWGCGCTRFNSKKLSEIYAISYAIGIPRRVIGFHNVLVGQVMRIVKDGTKRGWSVKT